MNASNKTAVELHPVWQDYLELCKPKIIALMLLTSFIGMLLAVPGAISVSILFWGNLGIAFCAGSASTINHLVDRKIDKKMCRTHNRPLAKGSVEPINAIIFACVIGITGMIILLVFVNALTAWLTLASLVGYALLYTIFLKRVTPQNIVIGGLSGASPPLLGWTAVTNSIDSHGLLLVLIIFTWTPPHFWALAVHRKDEYAKAGIPMLPVTHGVLYTKLHIVLYTVIMILVSILPFIIGMFNWLYFTGALVLGSGFLYQSILMLLNKHSNTAMKTFKYSIIYLTALFILMLLDHYLLRVRIS